MAEKTRRGPLPILLVVLDGMPDRPYRSLDGRTPMETACTPTMDSLAREGQSGFYYPLGPGRIPSTELAHFRIFGYEAHPFPGRACLEALGHEVPCTPGDVFSFLAPRRVERGPDGAFYVVGGYGERAEHAPAVYSALDGRTDEASGYRFEVFPIDGGEAILRIRQGDASEPPIGEVTDSDPFFFTDLPVLRPRPLASASRPETAARTGDALNRFLLEAAGMFDEGSSKTGPETLLVSKWTGTLVPLPPFAGLAGTAGASVASSDLFRGLARLIGLEFFDEPDGDLSRKLDRALGVLEAGEVGFVHVHTKVVDEAAHSGDPAHKVEVIEGLDREMAALRELPPDTLVLCVTSDHCTPVSGRSVHWGDSVPLLVRGPYVRVDEVTLFDERSATRGSLGQIGAGDVLPYLLCQADRAHFKGARPTPDEVLGIPQSGEVLTGSDAHGETPSWGCVHGRFQPFHAGHLEYVLRARQRCERLIVGITAADSAAIRKEDASPHRHEPASNPFTYFERLQMIQDTLLAEGLSPRDFAIVPFPIQDPGLIGHYVPEGTTHFVRVYSRWEEEKTRRLRDEGFPVETLDPGEEKKISGTEVRRLMREGLPWQHLVPRGAAEVVCRLLAEDPSRLRRPSSKGPS